MKTISLNYLQCIAYSIAQDVEDGTVAQNIDRSEIKNVQPKPEDVPNSAETVIDETIEATDDTGDVTVPKQEEATNNAESEERKLEPVAQNIKSPEIKNEQPQVEDLPHNAETVHDETIEDTGNVTNDTGNVAVPKQDESTNNDEGDESKLDPVAQDNNSPEIKNEQPQIEDLPNNVETPSDQASEHIDAGNNPDGATNGTENDTVEDTPPKQVESTDNAETGQISNSTGIIIDQDNSTDGPVTDVTEDATNSVTVGTTDNTESENSKPTENTNTVENNVKCDCETNENPEKTSEIANQPTEPTEASEFSCQSVGRFEVPNDCEKYFFCWDTDHGYAIFSCSHGRAFDPKSKLCVDNFAVCSSAPKCEKDKQIFTDPERNTSYFECKLHGDGLLSYFELRKEDCAKGREFNAASGFCKKILDDEDISSESDSSEKFECRESGIFIDFEDETKFYECIVKNVAKGQLKTVHRKCPKYHVFSWADKACILLYA